MPLGSVDPVRGVIYLLAFAYFIFRTYMSLCRLDNWQIASTSNTRDQSCIISQIFGQKDQDLLTELDLLCELDQHYW